MVVGVMVGVGAEVVFGGRVTAMVEVVVQVGSEVCHSDGQGGDHRWTSRCNDWKWHQNGGWCGTQRWP